LDSICAYPISQNIVLFMARRSFNKTLTIGCMGKPENAR
jgi:hypothetical protein